MKGVHGVALAALVASVAAVGVLAQSAAQAQPGHGKGEEQKGVAPAGEARAILEEAKGYRSWSTFPQYARPVLSKGHGGTYVVAWRNEAAAKGPTAGGQYPEGSVIVKENRPQPDADAASLTVMAKRNGSWFWIRATPDWKVFTRDGKPVAGPDVKGCVGCHTAAPNDLVFSK
ncbi:cytochrome P460 family protein [Anaeromyxobacter sp. Fw109-5]|uniref:cytochrome P460 family protein n=1 Tax=Anaeromyxobacter sp. (strain Fw109-5) TaxID=404589 RepID=UPI0000ED8109|nr:cytochrome P460 family protein [Anaeromyxobacter sp. Fw109-5]ABS27052.1 hypothetical protein Anae109_2852 [Anaeromyxobacter sp. Fw109-5]